jgi:hypothetical protein
MQTLNERNFKKGLAILERIGDVEIDEIGYYRVNVTSDTEEGLNAAIRALENGGAHFVTETIFIDNGFGYIVQFPRIIM